MPAAARRSSQPSPMRRSEEAPRVKLQADGLSKQYGLVNALTSMSITVEEGEFVSLLGPSGSGKTTFLMMVAGLILPDAGALWINGKLATYLPVQDRDIGMVFQNYALFPHLSVFENIAFALRMRKVPEAEIRARVGAALETVRLSHTADRLPRALSGGQQQRIALARCLVYKPSIILMDEPLGALDRKLREEMQLEIKHLHRALGTTLLYVTHDQDEAMTMSDRICLMRDGGIEQLAGPTELYFAPETEFAAAFLGDSNFLDAQVTGQEGACMVMTLPGGERILAPGNPKLRDTQVVRVMVRPERLKLGPAPLGMACNALTGEVTDTTLTAGLTRVYLAIPGGGQLIAASLTGTHEQLPEPGSLQTVHWPIGSTLLFPQERAR